MHIVLLILAAVLGVVLPDVAWADGVLNPIRGNTWDLYVFGNGRVIFDILNSIKMLMVPDAGTTGFQMLLLMLASVGFLVLAVAAGFDPGKNLLRMFTYILVVWGVSWGSTSLTANLNIHDMVVNKDGMKESYTVDRVPALVALPAALTSQVGYYFTSVIETYFTIPGEYKIGGEAGGQFNLFAKMIDESNEYMFTDAGVKNSLTAYVADCVVPAIAVGQFQGTVVDPLTGQSKKEYGAVVLSQSANLMEALGSASHKSIMTKVYPSSYSPAGKIPTEDNNGFGTIKTCEMAYKDLQEMMTANAQALANASAQAYAKAGVITPYETLFSSMLAGASAPGGGAAYSRPSGYILQQGMLNSMSGSFRQAALQTGNNELMTAAAIAQAEQNQRSAWVSSFHVFNNMMGYVFTVLQAFIFAITPMVVVALMVPGLGKSIFTNYAQILIWLTLWMPMLALINYIITLFGTDSIGATMAMSGGVSASNKGLLVERTNNMVIAAQFLGTMTPLLTWGLVKGALAFTEFISSGVGSAFASQAGATAASGNMSLNNLSMDNTSMNKFNTAMSSTVGTQTTNTFTNAGAQLTSQSMAGGVADKSGAAVDAKKAMSAGYTKSIQESEAASRMMTEAFSKTTSMEQALQYVKERGHQQGAEVAAQRIASKMKSAGKGDSTGTGINVDERSTEQAATGRDTTLSTNNKVGIQAKAGAGFNFMGTGGGVEASTGAERAAGDGQFNSNGANRAGSAATADNATKDQRSLTENGQVGTAASTTLKDANSASNSTSGSLRRSASEQAMMQEALSEQHSVTRSLSEARSVVENFGVASDMDMQTVNQQLARLDAMNKELGGDVAKIESTAQSTADAALGRRAQMAGEFAQAQSDIAAVTATLGPKGNGAVAQAAQVTKDAGGFVDTVGKEVKDQVGVVQTKHDNKVKEVTQKREAGAFTGPGGESRLLGGMNTFDGKKTPDLTDRAQPAGWVQSKAAAPR